MNKTTLDAMLNAEQLGLSRDGDFVRAGDDRPATITVVAGGDVIRFTKVTALHHAPDLAEHGLVGLERESSYLVIDATAIVAIERDTPKQESDKRRTGFV